MRLMGNTSNCLGPLKDKTGRITRGERRRARMAGAGGDT